MQIETDLLIAAAIGLGAGILLGALIAGLIAMRRIGRIATERAVLATQLANTEEIAAERDTVLELASERLTAAFDHLANRSLQNNSTTFLRLAEQNLARHGEKAAAVLTEKEKAVDALVKPVAEALKSTREQIERVERERHQSFGSITSQLESLGQLQQTLQAETANLVNALRRPEVRGQWGEITLKRVVELAGMVEHCDFDAQVHVSAEEGAMRPDMVVNLPERRQLVVDVKTPLDAYLTAVEAQTDEARDAALARHASQIKNRVRLLAGKAYWRQFRRSPEFVVLFLPGDQFLSAALSRQPDILEDALRQKVILATPSSLIALLKTVAYGWRQLTLAENAEKIRELAEDLYKRLATFTGHLSKMGNTLSQSVDAYNRAVGSLERQVLPGVRKFPELGVQAKNPVADFEPIETKTRDVAEIAVTDDTGRDR